MGNTIPYRWVKKSKRKTVPTMLVSKTFLEIARVRSIRNENLNGGQFFEVEYFLKFIGDI